MLASLDTFQPQKPCNERGAAREALFDPSRLVKRDATEAARMSDPDSLLKHLSRSEERGDQGDIEPVDWLAYCWWLLMIIFTLPLPGRWNSQDSSSKYIGKWPVAQDPLSASHKKLLFIMFSHGPTWSHYVSPDLALDTSVWSRSRHTKRTCREYCRSLTHQLNSTKSLSIFGTSWTSWRVARYQFHCSLFLGGPPKDRTVFPGYRRLHKFPRFPTFRPVKLGCTSWLQVLSGGSMSFPGMCCRIEEVEVMVWPVFFFRRGSMLWCYMTLPYNYNCIMCVYIYMY